MAKGKSALALALKKKIGSNDEIQKVSHWIDSGFPPLNKAISGRTTVVFRVGVSLKSSGHQAPVKPFGDGCDGISTETGWSGRIP